MKHILLNHLVTFKRKKVSDLNGFTYDNKLGFWIASAINASALIRHSEYFHFIQGSKKEDVETGEDLKGK